MSDGFVHEAQMSKLPQLAFWAILGQEARLAISTVSVLLAWFKLKLATGGKKLTQIEDFNSKWSKMTLLWKTKQR